jgi:calcium-activated chloride channel regulator 4
MQVIRENDDYKSSSQRSNMDTTPEFRYIQQITPPAIVLVLDTSGSMNDDNKLLKLRQVTLSCEG